MRGQLSSSLQQEEARYSLTRQEGERQQQPVAQAAHHLHLHPADCLPRTSQETAAKVIAAVKGSSHSGSAVIAQGAGQRQHVCRLASSTQSRRLLTSNPHRGLHTSTGTPALCISHRGGRSEEQLTNFVWLAQESPAQPSPSPSPPWLVQHRGRVY